MTNKPCLLDWTVLDLCEASYRSGKGYLFEKVKSFDILTATRWELVVVCLNAKFSNMSTVFDDIIREYSPLLIDPLPFDAEVQHILNLCKRRELPIVAQVADADEKCLVIATSHDPWIPWFKSIFCDYDEAEKRAVNDDLKPVIGQLLDDLDQQSS